MSKSYTVLDELQKLKVTYHLSNSRLTGRGLFDLLAEYPDMVHVLEDMERLCRDANAAGVLRSACWAQKGRTAKQHLERRITWRTFAGSLTVVFTGGIIFAQNAPLDDLPELHALRNRIPHCHLAPTNEEIIAKMRAISLAGYRHGPAVLVPEECAEVCEFVIGRCKQQGRDLDLRTLVNAFHDRLQAEAGHSLTDWQTMVDSRLLERVTLGEGLGKRAAQMEEETLIAREIDGMASSKKEKARLWKERTSSPQCPEGKSIAAYYRRLGRPSAVPPVSLLPKSETGETEPRTLPFRPPQE